MDWTKITLAVLLSVVCVNQTLSLPRAGHKKAHYHDKKAYARRYHIKVVKRGNHHANHHAAIGAPRQMVPSPVQDFVLLSGSPLFHDRTRAGDNNANVSMQIGKDQSGSQGHEDAAGQTLIPTQGHVQTPSLPLNVKPGQQVVYPHPNPPNGQMPQVASPPGHLQQQGTHGRDAGEGDQTGAAPNQIPGKDQSKNATSNPGMDQKQGETQPGTNKSVQIFTEGSVANRTAPAPQSNVTQLNASIEINNLKINGQRFGGAGVISLGQSVDQNNASTAKTESKNGAQDQKANGGNSPFNIPGIRHYGNGEKDSKQKGTEIGKDNGKANFDHQNLGPNCHWKTTKGKDGTIITSVACSGEFSKSEETKGGKTGGSNPKPLNTEQNVTRGDGQENKDTQEKAVNASQVVGSDAGKQIQSDGEFAKEAVETTNAFRKIHRSLPMKLDTELCREATEYAEKIASMGSLQHDYDAVRLLDEGENLAMGCRQHGVPLTAQEAITNWYNEVCAYDFDRSEFSMATGHFTQLAWSDSKEFGIGKAVGEQNGMPCVFVVARFKPSGNYKSEYKKNVFKGSFDPSYCDKLRAKKLL